CARNGKEYCSATYCSRYWYFDLW
nr:immunoglobulin heavy chain junction region [Macaca mulatta]MOV38755.1 immunoglobulin heavy chain junction region [Macaca mulatta]MOV38948.1 immunoglobulin heavy chain junction region [Macaca mulatta]MOV39287.1 immunoglobulin heavy chain junction region [Macaca mulatta]MOV39516.1 immunoglobulin heavy chain junction region [Macaca mulatta]